MSPCRHDASPHYREDDNHREHGPAEGKAQDSRGCDAVHETAACLPVDRRQSRQVAGRAVSIGYASQNRLRESVHSSLLRTSVSVNEMSVAIPQKGAHVDVECAGP